MIKLMLFFTNDTYLSVKANKYKTRVYENLGKGLEILEKYSPKLSQKSSR